MRARVPETSDSLRGQRGHAAARSCLLLRREQGRIADVAKKAASAVLPFSLNRRERRGRREGFDRMNRINRIVEDGSFAPSDKGGPAAGRECRTPKGARWPWHDGRGTADGRRCTRMNDGPTYQCSWAFIGGFKDHGQDAHATVKMQPQIDAGQRRFSS